MDKPTETNPADPERFKVVAATSSERIATEYGAMLNRLGQNWTDDAVMQEQGYALAKWKVILDARKFAEDFLGKASSPEARRGITRDYWKTYSQAHELFEFYELHQAIWAESVAWPDWKVSESGRTSESGARELQNLLTERANWIERSASILNPTLQERAEGLAESKRTAAEPERTTQPSPPVKNKPGPKPNYEIAVLVAGVVAQIAPDGNLRAKLNEISEALDGKEVPVPKPWPKRYGVSKWADCHSRNLVVKAIEHHLKLAKQRHQATN